MPAMLPKIAAETLLADTAVSAAAPAVLGEFGAGAGALGSMSGLAAIADPITAGLELGQNMALSGGIAGSAAELEKLAQIRQLMSASQTLPSLASATAPAAAETAPIVTPWGGITSGAGLSTSPTSPFNLTSVTTIPPAATEVTPIQEIVKPSFAREELAGPAANEPVDSSRSMLDDITALARNPNWQNIKDFAKEYPLQTAGGLYALYKHLNPMPKYQTQPQYLRPYTSTRQVASGVSPYGSSAERQWFTGGLEALPIQRLAVGGPIETMSALNAVGQNTNYPQAQLQTTMYSNPQTQRPIPGSVLSQGLDTPVDPYTGEQKLASGGLGGYSDGGNLLRGPGDGVSDSIPAVIGNRQPARLADGEFVVPARIVSELGNGSTEAGAKKLYAMMDRIQRARHKSVGKDKVAVDTKSDKYLPA